MKVKTITLLAASMLFAATATLNAQDGEGKERKGRGDKGGRMFGGGREGMERGQRGGLGMMMKDLNLTDEQKEKMKGVHESNSEKMKELGKAMAEAQKSLREASEGDTIDEAKIREICKTVADNMAEMAILRAKMKKEVDAILTDEQKAKMEEKKAEMKTKMEERRKQMQERMGKRKEKKEGEGDQAPPPAPPAE